MSSESELREAMRSAAKGATTGIDADAVVRGARARRVPKQLAFSSVSVLAVVGVAALGITTLPSLLPGQTGASDSGSTTSMQVPESDHSGAGAEEKFYDSRLVSPHLCGMPVTAAEPNIAGLLLSTDFPDVASADGRSIKGTVTLTNEGATHVTGLTALEPVVTVSRDGITLWHSNPILTSLVVQIDLAPGQSHTYSARVAPVECAPQDDERERFRDDLPALAAGDYELRAELVFVPDAAHPSEAILVGGEAELLQLR